MTTVYSNRALGILSSFIQENTHARVWLLPANICFSVPFLLISLGRTISFSDFGLGSEPIEFALAKHRRTDVGVMLINHYGVPWDNDAISSVRHKSSLVVLDACLSVPDLRPSPSIEVDLALYSTGKGKVVDLGYGAFGYLINPYAEKIERANRHGFSPAGYDLLDLYWKQVLEGLPFAKEMVLLCEWCDEGNDLITDPAAYFATVEAQLNSVLQHKMEINKIYSDMIDDDFHWHPNGNNWRFNIMVDDAGILIKELFSRGLFASRHYANAANRIGDTGSYPFANMVERHMVNLFNSAQITLDFAERCARTIQNLLDKGSLKPMRSVLP
jgi:hypothetical protein